MIKERLNFLSPLDEENVAPLLTMSKICRYLHKKLRNYVLIIKLLHSRYGLEGSFLNKATANDLKLLW